MVAWPKMVMIKMEKTGKEVESTGLNKRLKGVRSEERKEGNMTPIFLTELDESRIEEEYQEVGKKKKKSSVWATLS